MSFVVGQIVGDYEIVRRLGVGGMGAVYQARNLITDRDEALKVLLPDLRSTPDLAERFLREIKVHASLMHPSIASLHTALRLDNQLLMVMEYIPGVSLEERLQRGGPLPLGEGIGYVLQLLDALAYAHGRGVTHRDIKPANVMITPEGVVKLMDFGIASTGRDRRLTQTGMAVGSLPYMSPEQILAQPADHRSDLYAVGVMLYEIATGRRPIEATSDYGLMHGHLQLTPEPAIRVNPQIAEGLSLLMSRALAKPPVERFQSADEFRDALQPWRGETSRPLYQAATISRTPPASASLASATPSKPSWDPKVLEAAKKALSVYIGPVARILVDRTASRTHDVSQLYASLAAEIPTPGDREKFLATKPSR